MVIVGNVVLSLFVVEQLIGVYMYASIDRTYKKQKKVQKKTKTKEKREIKSKKNLQYLASIREPVFYFVTKGPLSSCHLKALIGVQPLLSLEDLQ